MNQANQSGGGERTIIGYCSDHRDYHQAEADRWDAMQKAMLMAFPNLSDDDRHRISVLLRRAREQR